MTNLGIGVSGLIRDQAKVEFGVADKEATKFSDIIDRMLKDIEWVSLYDGTTFEKTFTPGQPQRHLNTGLRCACMRGDVKLALEGALIHEVRRREESAQEHKDQAEEFKQGNPSLAESHLNVVRAEEEYVRKLDIIREALKDVPKCKTTEAFKV